MKLLFLPSALLVLLASCGPNKHVNSWDRQSSALDPVGITSKKMAAKNRAEQAFYKPGEAVTFKKDRMMVFEQNPEIIFHERNRQGWGENREGAGLRGFVRQSRV